MTDDGGQMSEDRVQIAQISSLISTPPSLMPDLRSLFSVLCFLLIVI